MQLIISALLFMNVQADFLVILNLVIIESLLSIDNAAVLATMAMDLPKEQRSRALRYGIIGAYVFRGLALLFASFLVKIWWLKVVGGFYLLFLAYDYFSSKATPQHEDDTLEKMPGFFKKYIINPILSLFNVVLDPPKKLFHKGIKRLGIFWYTVILIELMDLAFSVDNVFAAVAFTKNIYLICIGVFIGILAMRFVAQYFIVLMEKYFFLENLAFIVIAILGVKLSSSLVCHLDFVGPNVCEWLESEQSEWLLSALCFCVFFIPILTSWLFGYPINQKKNNLK